MKMLCKDDTKKGISHHVGQLSYVVILAKVDKTFNIKFLVNISHAQFDIMSLFYGVILSHNNCINFM